MSEGLKSNHRGNLFLIHTGIAIAMKEFKINKNVLHGER